MKKIFYLLFVLVCFFSIVGFTNAKSATCTYGNEGGISVIVGLDKEGKLVSKKNDNNPAEYKFNEISVEAFKTENGEYYCPEKIAYSLSYVSGNRYNTYKFSFIADVNYPTTLNLRNSEIDNSVDVTETKKTIDHTCAYGDKGIYVINYYTDGTIGAANSSYTIRNDIPANRGCLSEVYLCRGNVISKEIYSDNTNCVIEKLFSGDIDDNTDIIETGCNSYLGNPVYDETKTTQSPAYYLQLAFKIMKYAAIILLLVLTIVEFVKASTSNDQNAIKKAFQNTIKRVIVAVIIFILPELIKFLLTVLGVYSPSTCGIK